MSEGITPEQLQRIRAADDVESLNALLQRVDAMALSERQSEVIARKLSWFPPDESALRMAFVGNYTLEPIAARTSVHVAVAGMRPATWVAPYGQYMQAVLDAGSGLADFAPRVIFLDLALRALAPQLYGAFPSLNASIRVAERDRILGHLDDWVRAALAATDALLLIGNFPRPAYAAFGAADAREPLGESEFYLDLNLELLRRYRGERRVCIVDLDRLVLAHGAERAVSDRFYHIAKMPWSEGFTARLADELTRYAVAASGTARKCLVVDLDNTLWGGVVGEDGPDALAVGSGTAAGEAYVEFQRALKGLQARGVLLAICSKNNPEDVDDAFRVHADMPLARDDFVAERINWELKSANIAAIADELNIGVDAIAFVDDNPVERELVRGALPDVAVIDLPADPADYASALKRQPIFDRLDVTADDRAKTGQYVQQTRRRRFERAAGDLAFYLAGLETELIVRPARPSDVARVHQLFTKTNQFNITTRRYTLPEVERFVEDDRYDLCTARLRDRFGDMGIIALYLVYRNGEAADVDSFIMSCRALGRGAETAVMNRLKACHAGGVNRITASFVPTAKNAPAAEFLPQQGFSLIGEEADGTQRYELNPRFAAVIDCSHIAVVTEDE